MDKDNKQQKNSILNRAAMFESKNKSDNKKDEKPKEKPKIKKLNGQEFLNKMSNNQSLKEQERKNQINDKKQNMNSINNNLVKNSINNFANKEEELKQKKIQDELDQAEKKARAQITIEKTMQIQKAKLEEKRENDATEAENKRI